MGRFFRNCGLLAGGLFGCLLVTMETAFAQEPVPHPRLLMREGAEPTVSAGGVVAKADSVIVAFSDAVLDEPPVTRVMVGRRLLHTSREALKRIFWLGLSTRCCP